MVLKNPWRNGVGASGSEGVANTIKNSPNSIGYVELDYAHTKGIAIALVKNPMTVLEGKYYYYQPWNYGRNVMVSDL
jgi:ABC-type phosphate transport system substrate-binding protein